MFSQCILHPYSPLDKFMISNKKIYFGTKKVWNYQIYGEDIVRKIKIVRRSRHALNL